MHYIKNGFNNISKNIKNNFIRKNYKDSDSNFAIKKDIALQLILKLGFENFTYTDTLRIGDKNYMTISDYFHSNISSFENPNNSEWIYKNIQHSYDVNDVKLNFFSPFIDDMWLTFRQEQYLSRCLNGLLLCPDLLDIDLYSNHEGRYNFYDKYKDIIPKAQEILDYWGENNCKNILLEDNDNELSDNN